jgi:hypothetical protein
MTFDQWITAVTAAAVAVRALAEGVSVAMKWRESRRSERDRHSDPPACGHPERIPE